MLITQFLCVSLYAQKIEWKTIDTNMLIKDFQSVLHNYENMKTYSMQLTYISYKDSVTQEVSDRSVGFYKKDKQHYHSYIMENRTIQNDQYKFVVDEYNKMIIVSKPDSIASSGLGIGTANLNTSAIAFVKKTIINGENRYRIEYENGLDITAIEYIISKEGLIKEISMFYNRSIIGEKGNVEVINPRVVMTFTSVSKKFTPDKQEFDHLKYFTEKDNKLYPASEFSNYEIYDYRK